MSDNRNHGRRLFNIGQQDSEIMAAAEELDIKLLRLSGGRVSGTFKITGDFGACLADLIDRDEELPEADPAETREALQFANGLMRQFSRGRRDGSGGSGDGPAFGCCG